MKFRTLIIAPLIVVCVSCESPGSRDPGAGEPQPDSASTVTFLLKRDGLPLEGNWKCDPVVADINADGHMDIAAHARLSDSPRVWLGTADGSWQDASDGLVMEHTPCGGGLDFGDVNEDSQLDLVVADHCRGVFVYLGDGAGNWELVVDGLYPELIVPANEDAALFTGAEDVTLADVDGDGHLDIVAGGADVGGGVSVYWGDGTGRNWERALLSLPIEGVVNRVLVAVVNAVSVQDILASHHPGPRVWYGAGRDNVTPAFDGLPSPTLLGLYHGLRVADVNEDGRPDLIVSNWVDGPEVYLQGSDGKWNKTPDVFPEMFGGSYSVAVADLDQDGHLDMVVSGRMQREVGFVYGVFFLRGDGAGKWTWERNSGLPSTGLPFTWGITLADVDGDGTKDIIAGSGGIVATRPGEAEPEIPAGMLVWLTR